ncbi:hypothetical protein [Algoriphagus sp.]|uniref:hypothetical protein n=1 Tax=Algoriphagus sp. TaxID=1872435 RepID=UPI0025E0F282|nr:hypothetical protein [Algoriphagus sp.]
MKKISLIILSIIGIITFSCSSEFGDLDPDSEFIGNWAGEFSGDVDHGTWTMTIVVDGTISGIAISEVWEENYKMEGQVSRKGDLKLTVGTVSGGAIFTGQIENGIISGEWSNEDQGLKGTWSGTKQ